MAVIDLESVFPLYGTRQLFDQFRFQIHFRSALFADHMVMRFQTGDLEPPLLAGSGHIHQMDFLKEFQIAIYRGAVQMGGFSAHAAGDFLDGHPASRCANRIEDGLSLRRYPIAKAAYFLRVVQ
jgi:hypothetical protein